MFAWLHIIIESHILQQNDLSRSKRSNQMMNAQLISAISFMHTHTLSMTSDPKKSLIPVIYHRGTP